MRTQLLLIDNYDSFTYNLVQAFLVLGAEVEVHRNDALSVEQALAKSPSHLVVSPGPGTPAEAGVSKAMIAAFAGRIPILGVCLGHQSLVEVFGGKIIRAGRLMHGKTSKVNHDGLGVFAGLPQPFIAGRYHSLIAEAHTMPNDLQVTARTAEGEIMGVRHKNHLIEGVQFHPESVLTPDGPALMANFEVPMTALRQTLERILNRRDLSEAEAGELLRQLADETIAPAMAGAVLAGLRSKGVNADEVRGFAIAMRALARKPLIAAGLPAVDIVGTGGDSSGSLNLSTGAALLTAACGLPVIKHGNRSISSRCGSADLIEALGLKMPLDEQAAARCFEATGFTFLFAPFYHPATQAVAAVRSALGVRTVFNLLGPLTNPGAPRFYVIGAYSGTAARLIADALRGMPVERAWVIHGAQGWDEATPLGPFMAYEVDARGVREHTVDPEQLGIGRVAESALAGGDAAANCEALIDVFERRDRGAHRDALALQCALALQVAGRVESLEAGLSEAFAALESGRAGEWLAKLRTFAAGGGPVRGFLDEMAQSSRERVKAALKRESAAALAERARAMPAAPELRLSAGGFDVIAELKLRSPAQGALASRSDDWLERIARYAAGGAAAVSVLTEPSRFDGSLQDLSRAAAALSAPAAVSVPCMRKDFLVDPYQVLEARTHGAAGVLVILRMLARNQIEAMLDTAAGLGMFVLLEAFDHEDLTVAHALADARNRVRESILLGINCRDLQTLQVVPSRFAELAGELPSVWPAVAESGVNDAADARRVAELGYRLALVGTALMSHQQPETLLAGMLAASRHSTQ